MLRSSGLSGERQPPQRRVDTRVIVAGGSLGGLNAALWLRDVGCDVEIYERSRSPLEGRGAGIVLHPATIRYFTRHRILDIGRISGPARWVRYLEPSAIVAHEEPCRYRFTSWTTLYRALAGTARPLYVRHLSIEALPSTVVPPQDGLVVRRPNFQFVVRERG